jgi:hypothetical protein
VYRYQVVIEINSTKVVEPGVLVLRANVIEMLCFYRANVIETGIEKELMKRLAFCLIIQG